MISESDAEHLWKMHSSRKIIQIYGKAGSGKSTLMLYFLKRILLSDTSDKILLLDTERKITPKRMNDILGECSRYLLVSQPKNFIEQQSIIRALSTIQIPVTAVVIDTVSRHFRTLEREDSWNAFSKNVYYFYENHILPLLVFQEKMDCYLILIHQITSIPEKGNKPFLYKMFESIRCDWIHLE